MKANSPFHFKTGVETLKPPQKKYHESEKLLCISQTKQTIVKAEEVESDSHKSGLVHQYQIIHNFFCSVSYKNIQVIDQYVTGP